MGGKATSRRERTKGLLSMWKTFWASALGANEQTDTVRITKYPHGLVTLLRIGDQGSKRAKFSRGEGKQHVMRKRQSSSSRRREASIKEHTAKEDRPHTKKQPRSLETWTI